jgi:tRNA(Ile2)-agmatinylcytidine synthase
LTILHVGIDDTDSKKGMCTTYLTAVILDELDKLNIKPIDFPKLIRLNPNCPYKTRGNAALSFSLQIDDEMVNMIKKLVLENVERYADLKEKGTDPGVAFLCGRIPQRLNEFSRRAMYEILTIKEAIQLSRDIGAQLYRYKYGRGIIGALAAIGSNLERNNTFELITYRLPKNRGTKRNIDLQSVIEMDRLTFPYTFDNIDYESKEIRIAPHTPCPVLFGIRGTNPEILLNAMRMVNPNETIERYRIFISNQGTDAHIQKSRISEVKVNSSARIRGFVYSPPMTKNGGHVFFKLKDETGIINCAAFEPTKDFRKVILALSVGDEIEVFGSVKKKVGFPITLNLEKIYVYKLTQVVKILNPLCPNCNSRMKSEGREKGYECTKCQFRIKQAEKQKVVLPRKLDVGLYVVPSRARRHLSKPIVLVDEI